MRWAVAACALIGCGRIDFDPLAFSLSTLALDRDDPGERLADFPLLVVLDDSRAARDLLDANATNLRFMDSAGNVIPHEVERPGRAGGEPLIAWVRVPVIIGTTTSLSIAIGDGLPPASTDTVWNASYAAVYHLASGASDATGSHDGTGFRAGEITTSAGKVGSGQSFASPGGSAFVIPDSGTLDLPAITASGWMFQRTASGAYMTLISRELGATNADNFWIGSFVNQLHSEVSIVGGPAIFMDTTTPITVGQWHHLALAADASSVNVYLDGTFVRSLATGAAVAHDPNAILIGADANAGVGPDQNFLDGDIDEVRIERVVRSANWIRYDDASQRDSVISYGPVER